MNPKVRGQAMVLLTLALAVLLVQRQGPLGRAARSNTEVPDPAAKVAAGPTTTLSHHPSCPFRECAVLVRVKLTAHRLQGCLRVCTGCVGSVCVGCALRHTCNTSAGSVILILLKLEGSGLSPKLPVSCYQIQFLDNLCSKARG